MTEVMLMAIARAALRQRAMIARHGATCGSFDFTNAIDRAIGVSPDGLDVESKIDETWRQISKGGS